MKIWLSNLGINDAKTAMRILVKNYNVYVFDKKEKTEKEVIKVLDNGLTLELVVNKQSY